MKKVPEYARIYSVKAFDNMPNAKEHLNSAKKKGKNMQKYGNFINKKMLILSVGFLCCILVSGAVYGDEVYSPLGEVCRLGGLDLESGDVAVCAPGLSCIYDPNNDYKGYCMPLCSNLTYTRPQYENDYDMTFVTHGWDYASGDSGQLRTFCALSEDGGGVSGNSVSAYRCDNDYYGDIGLGSPAVCSECPDGGQALVTNNTSVTDCYKYSGHDVSGTFTFKGKKCYYTTE